jgi:hypothetical protein
VGRAMSHIKFKFMEATARGVHITHLVHKWKETESCPNMHILLSSGSRLKSFNGLHRTGSGQPMAVLRSFALSTYYYTGVWRA